jgi:cytochrome P450
LLGLVAPNRCFVSLLSRLGAGRATTRFLNDLPKRYACDHLWACFPVRRTLLVFDPQTIDAVLRSEENAADPVLKKCALSRFVPDALVISSGAEWRDRRDFNEKALNTGTLHQHHDAFAEIVCREVESLTRQRPDALRWGDFQALAERISQQVILGAGELRPEMTRQLARMVGRSNVLLRHRPSFSAFYEQIDRDLARQLQAAPTPCLMHDSAALLKSGSAGASTRVPTQIGFWFFVLKDAVELHVARTLALIAAHPDVQKRVREEVRAAGTLTAQAIDGLRYLEACIGEQLRLWTPVPMLLRRAVRPFSLRGEIAIDAEQQILIHTGSYHRNPRFFGKRADSFSPDACGGHPAVYPFSDQRQSCAGKSLAIFVLKATLASLLGRFRFEIPRPAVEPGSIPHLYDHFKLALRPFPDA